MNRCLRVVNRRLILLVVVAATCLWSKEAWVSGSSSAELVRDLFRLRMDTPSIVFATAEDEMEFHSGFRDESSADMEWLANRIQASLDGRDRSAIELGTFQPDLPEVNARLDPDEEGSLERAPRGPVRYLIGLRIEGEARFHVPSMTMVQLELTLLNRPTRETLQALVASLETALAAPE